MAKTGDDGAVVRKMLEGSDEAWAIFMEQNAPVVTRTIRMTLNKYARRVEAGEVEDVFQDVMLRLLADEGRLLRAFNPLRASLRTWLAVIARSTALDALRRRPAHEVKMPEDWLEKLPAEDSPSSEALFPHPALSERQNQVMRLIFDRGLAVAEISKLLSVAEQTVRSLKHQAIERLRAISPAWAQHEKRPHHAGRPLPGRQKPAAFSTRRLSGRQELPTRRQSESSCASELSS